MLAKVGQGPHLYYEDKNFRLEEFLESTVLDPKNMLAPGHLEEIAISLSEFHRVKPDLTEISSENLIKKTFINNKEKILKVCQEKLN